MNYISNCKTFFTKPFFRDFRTLAGLWLLLGVLAAIMKQHSSTFRRGT